MFPLDVRNLRLTTAKLYWQPAGESGWIDFGNVTSYKDEPQRERLPHFQSKKGFKQVDFELVKTDKTKRSFTLDEHFSETIKQLQLGTQLDDVVQAAQEDVVYPAGGPEQLEPGDYFIGYEKLLNVTYTGVGGPVLGVDYTIDVGAGVLTILSNFWLAPLITFELTFDCEEVTRMNFKAFSALLTRGKFKFLEFDQHSEQPVSREEFNGQCYIAGWGENTGEGYNEFILEVLHET